MLKNEVYEIIEKALKEVCKISSLPEKEVKNLASLISAIANSSEETRIYFYKEVYKIAIKIEQRLANQKRELEERIKLLEEEIAGENKKKLLN